MKILGIRNTPSKIRFCILEGDKLNFVFTNCNDENKIDLPKSLKTEFEIYQWVKSEYERRVSQNDNVLNQLTKNTKPNPLDVYA